METRVQTPGQLFQLTQTLEIPLFQRPYVWTEERQWAPLWEDVVRLVDLRMDQAPSATHFLGAVVMQQSSGPMGFAAEYTLIDGQQRLTTLQLLLNAASSALRDAGQVASANNLRKLTLHDEGLGFTGTERLKVRHTNGDGVPFQAAMLSSAPADEGASPAGAYPRETPARCRCDCILYPTSSNRPKSRRPNRKAEPAHAPKRKQVR